MNDIDRFIEALIEQDTLPGTNSRINEDVISEMKMMTSVEDIKAYAIATVGLTGGQVNNALINSGLDAGTRHYWWFT